MKKYIVKIEHIIEQMQLDVEALNELIDNEDNEKKRELLEDKLESLEDFLYNLESAVSEISN